MPDQERQPDKPPPDKRPVDELTADELRAKLRAAELEEGRMPFFEHLRELRDRLRNAIIALILGFGIAYFFKEDIFVFLAGPLSDVWANLHAANPKAIPDATPTLVFTGPVEAFWTYFSLAFWAGVFIASPVVFHQLWKFIAPGLYKKERKLGLLFAISSALLFVAGAAFCYRFVLPQVYDFLLGYSSGNLSEMTSLMSGNEGEAVDKLVALKPMLKMNEYLDFAKKMLIGFGLAFELPLVIFFLALIGVVNHRSLWRFNRWAIVLAFVIGAILTPSADVASQLLLAGPLLLLYNLSIILAYFVTKRRERRDAAFMGDADVDGDDSGEDDSAEEET